MVGTPKAPRNALVIPRTQSSWLSKAFADGAAAAAPAAGHYCIVAASRALEFSFSLFVEAVGLVDLSLMDLTGEQVDLSWFRQLRRRQWCE